MPEGGAMHAVGGSGCNDAAKDDFRTRKKEEVYAEVNQLVQRTLGLFPEDAIMTQTEMKRHIWKLAYYIHDKLRPKGQKDPVLDSICAHLWGQTKYMLRQLIDFDGFNADPSRTGEGVHETSETEVARVLKWYQTYLVTGEVVMKHERPHCIFDGDDVMAVDKPAGFLCSFGTGVPKVIGAPNATELLNAQTDFVQIHEWIALSFQFECAVKTREFWATKPTCLPCTSPIQTEGGCQECPGCGYAIAGVANRLDKETSGIFLVGKTGEAFVRLRKDFGNKNESKMEKQYIALVHGKVEPVPEGWAVTHVALKVENRKSVPWTEEDDKRVEEMASEERSRLSLDDSRKRQAATTFYRPLAHYHDDSGTYTLMQYEIVTGRRHQIRFHSSQLGHPLVGDVTYGAPDTDRTRFSRIFLHSYRTRFREPITGRRWEAVAPLPSTLVKAIVDVATKGGQVNLNASDVGPSEMESALSDDRRKHPIQILGRSDPGALAPLLRQVGDKEKLYSFIAGAGEMEPSTGAPQLAGPSPATPLWPMMQSPPEPIQGMPGWYRKESRSNPGEFYAWNPLTNETKMCGPGVQAAPKFGEPVPGKPHLRLCRSTKDPTAFYHWNAETGESLPCDSQGEKTSAKAPEITPAVVPENGASKAPVSTVAAVASVSAPIQELGIPGAMANFDKWEILTSSAGHQILWNPVRKEATPLGPLEPLEPLDAMFKERERHRHKAELRTRSSKPPARTPLTSGAARATWATGLHPSGALGNTAEGLVGQPSMELRGTPRRRITSRRGMSMPRRKTRPRVMRKPLALAGTPTIDTIDLTIEETPPAKRRRKSDALALSVQRRWTSADEERRAARIIKLLESCRLEDAADAVYLSSARHLLRQGVTYSAWEDWWPQDT